MIGLGSPRYRRLLLLVGSIAVILYTTVIAFPTKHTQGLHALHDELTDSIVTTFSDFLGNYFESDDNNSLLEHITNSDIDLKEESLKTHLETGALKAENPKSQEFYTQLIRLMYSKKEQIPELGLTKLASDDKGSFWSKEQLLKYLVIDEKAISTFKAIHEEIVQALPTGFPADLYKGTGIVMIGGGQYSWLSLLSIKSLRSFGCKLPIEMIIPTVEEYEHDMCEEILPALGGRCVLLHNVLGEELMKEIPFKGYQYKSLALIASSFNNVLFLDSDNVLVSNPEQFFLSEPFLSTGMVTWPDYWERTTSPYLYDIMGIEVDDTTRVRDGKWPLAEPEKVEDLTKVRYHDLNGTFPEISSESGQIMIRKSDHVKTLFLSLFYNIYGPGFFYRLISQGFDGEGDKDTFVIAAVKGGEKFYQVHSEIQTFGWFDEGKFNGVAMGQRSPLEDFAQVQKVHSTGAYSEFDTRSASVFTVHANYPKLNPFLLYKEKKLINGKGEDFRMYSDISHALPDKFDFEFVQYKRMNFLLCELNISLKYFNEISREELCGFINGHLEFLQKNPINV